MTPPECTYLDMAMEILADSEAELRERIASLEADVEVYRLIALQAIHALHDVTIQRDAAFRTIRGHRDIGQEDEDAM